MNLPIYCPNCGQQLQTISFTDETREVELNCKKCNVATGLKVIEMEREDGSRSNEGYLFEVHIILDRQPNATLPDDNLEPAWNCLLCGKPKLYEQDEGEFLYRCRDCGAKYYIQTE